MAVLKSYRKFIHDLPSPLESFDNNLVDIYHPVSEPTLDGHHELLSSFEEWLIHPNINPSAFPENATDTSSDLGGWVALCNLRWVKRYEAIAMRAELREKAANGALTGSLLAVLGAVGLDGAIEGADEWLQSVSLIAAKLGIPIPLAAIKAKALRNKKLLADIKGHLE